MTQTQETLHAGQYVQCKQNQQPNNRPERQTVRGEHMPDRLVLDDESRGLLQEVRSDVHHCEEHRPQERASG